MLMERAAPEKLPAETEDQGLVGMLTVHQRSQWFHAQKRYQEALESRQRSVDLLLPPTSQGLLGPVPERASARAHLHGRARRHTPVHAHVCVCAQDTQHLMPVLKAFLGSLRDLCILLDDIERATGQPCAWLCRALPRCPRRHDAMCSVHAPDACCLPWHHSEHGVRPDRPACRCPQRSSRMRTSISPTTILTASIWVTALFQRAVTSLPQ